MKFGFGDSKEKSGIGKLAELFDLQQGSKQSDKQFRQQAISTVDFYKNVQQKETRLANQQQEKIINIDKNTAMYEVISYDEQLIKTMKNKALKTNQFPLGTQRVAKDLLKFKMENIPKIYVDTSGNVWELKEQ